MSDTTHLPTMDELLAVYGQLDDNKKFLLQFLGVVDYPVSEQLFAKCLSRLSLFYPDRNFSTGLELSRTLDRFRNASLIDDKNRTPGILTEYLTRRAARESHFPAMAKAVRAELPATPLPSLRNIDYSRLLRELRFQLYAGDTGEIDKLLSIYQSRFDHSHTTPYPLICLCTNPFDQEWFRELPVFLRFYLLERLLSWAATTCFRLHGPVAYLRELCLGTQAQEIPIDELIPFARIFASYCLVRGDLRLLRALLQKYGEIFAGSGYMGSFHLLKGNLKKARTVFAEEKAHLFSLTGNDQGYFFGYPALFAVLAEIIHNDQAALTELHARLSLLVRSRTDEPDKSTLAPTLILLTYLTGDTAGADTALDALDVSAGGIPLLLYAMVSFFISREVEQRLIPSITAAYTHCINQEFFWPAMEFAALLERARNNGRNILDEHAPRLQKTGIAPLIPAMDAISTWEQQLQALLHVTLAGHSPVKRDSCRLSWEIDMEKTPITISAKIQKRGQRGTWSKGKPVPCSTLVESIPDCGSDHDRRIIKTITIDSGGDTPTCSLDLDRALPALVGHPFVFLAQAPWSPVELVAGEPELFIRTAKNELIISFAPTVGLSSTVLVTETPTRMKVVAFSEQQRRIARIIGSRDLRVPACAEDQVMELISQAAAHVTVHSDILPSSKELGLAVEEVEASPLIHIHLQPLGGGFKLEMFVKPFSMGGPYLKPGQGGRNITTEINGRRFQTCRDLEMEELHARHVEESCPMLDLSVPSTDGGERSWTLLEPEDCLQVLMELDALGKRVIIEWPEGRKIGVVGHAGFDQLSVSLRQERNWFELDGELKVNEDIVFDMKALLALTRDKGNRFIPLGRGQFIALTDEFRRQLEDLADLVQQSKTKQKKGALTFHAIHALKLQELTSRARTVHADASWTRLLHTISRANEIESELPSTLQAGLRDYQVEGFTWLSRLAAWGAGACLADDMGLGKTVQALALILSRSGQGPTLVVAPTSVCPNWMEEAKRFTPTLSVHLLTGNERKKCVDSLGPLSILIASYTMLQQEKDLLAPVQWATVVLDEAQAIKNAATKRSRAAMSLSSGFHIITTGTPIENNLTELWNLFQFINPGLLGSRKNFSERFVAPIERHQDQLQRMRLKKLVRPFILRRIKSDVLDELPPKTEITLPVAMYEEELALYENLRQEALVNLGTNPENPVQILAEIMKLRRASCNPRLIVADARFPCAKEETFFNLVDDLLEGNHQALVFSQFVTHLSLLRQGLDKKKIRYSYLDGSTPQKKRSEAINNFQAGETDLFLISLRAGGLGLNLTAADYVIHLDPWWNPAIEDQASDRAHRIGQKRPVTIYRLVAKDTIEEKIMSLHREKKDLASSLLEGTDSAARVTPDELVRLLKDEV